MQELLAQIVKGIVNNPQDVFVVVRESVDFPGLTILEVSVAAEDKGILIGRRGRTINAIRDIMTICAIRNEKRIKVLVKEDENDPHHSKPARPAHEESAHVAAPVAQPTEVIEPGNSVDDVTNADDYLSDEI